MTSNALVLTQLLIQLLSQAQSIGQLLRTARAEDRDVTDEELDTLAGNDDAVRAALDAEIQRQREEGG